MTVIETCRADEANPFDYMMAVVRNLKAVKLDPGGWMPWNYLETIAQIAESALRALPFSPVAQPSTISLRFRTLAEGTLFYL